MAATLDLTGLQAELADVEDLLADVLQDRSGLVVRMGRHTAEAGGKRLRPMLCLLAGAFGRPEHRHSVVRTAAGLELIHHASLIHDDVADRAATRRGRPTLAHLWGPGLAVLAGDWLFAASFELLYGDEDPRLIRLVARMVRELCAGAIEEAELSGSFSEDLQPYYDRIYRKTAVFFETACKAGAMAGGAPAPAQEALGAYGRRLGLAFQIIDDVLDFTGEPGRTGKPIGSDLRAGICTMPMVLGARDPAIRRMIQRCLGHPHLSEERVRQVAAALGEYGALDEARRAAADLAAGACRALEGLGASTPGPVAELCALADMAVRRDC